MTPSTPALLPAFSIVVTDLNMPVMDGIGLIQRLRAHPTYKYVPIVAESRLAGGAVVIVLLSHSNHLFYNSGEGARRSGGSTRVRRLRPSR